MESPLNTAARHSAHIILAEIHLFAREYALHSNEHTRDNAFDRLFQALDNEDTEAAQHLARAVNKYVAEYSDYFPNLGSYIKAEAP